MEKVLASKGLKFIYTEYKTSEGIGILSKVLKANGYCPFSIKKPKEGDWELDISEEDIGKPKYAVWSGDEESDIILRIYNNQIDTLPEKLKRQITSIFPNPDNKRGNILEVLMTTKQGAEGLNTRNVRQVHVVEPYWNPVRLDQVIGRAVRVNSHLQLPLKDRNVDIYIYLSKATKQQLKKNVTMMNDFGGMTSDEVLFDIAERKRKIMNILLGMMKDSAIDCALHLADNIEDDPNIKCVNVGEIQDRNSYASTIDIKDELKEKERKTREKTIVQRFKTLQIKRNGIPTKISRMEDKIYDYERVESGRPGNPIGYITYGKTGKPIIKFY